MSLINPKEITKPNFGEKIVLFYPNIPKKAIEYVTDTLKSRWIGQGPKVDLFEKNFTEKFTKPFFSISSGSGTDALHLSYILANLKPGDEVIVPVFTCVATNIPLLYMGVKIKFADIQPDTLNINPNHVSSLVNEKTKAIVCVHYGGFPCDMDELQKIAGKWNIPIIEDAAHALGAKYKNKYIGSISDFTAFSFQAVKHLTTGDGGMLSLKDRSLINKAKKIRWFGIDRNAKQLSKWENDITEVGYKYQMTDISAALGLAALEEFDETLTSRKRLFSLYKNKLANIPGLKFVDKDENEKVHAAWLCTIIVENRSDLEKKLSEYNIESNQVHYRNDKYSIFGGRRNDLPNMDEIEYKYLVLPLHTKMNVEQVERVCNVIRSGW